MFGKKYDIILIPQNGGRIKNISITRTLPVLIFVLVVALVGVSLYFNSNLRNLEGQVGELDRLRLKAVKQNVQIYAFADKVRLLEQEIAKLTQHNKKLSALTYETIELAKETPPALGGFESGSDSGPLARLKGSESRLIRQMHANLDSLLAQTSYIDQSQHRIDNFLEDARSFLAAVPTLMPTRGNISSRFGYRLHPITKRREFHRGLDINARRGVKVVSPADGVVVSSSRKTGYGLMIVVNHGYGIVTRYGHLSKSFVKAGTLVNRGETLAAVGSSGRTTGPHLHYEIIVAGVAVNPVRYLAHR